MHKNSRFVRIYWTLLQTLLYLTLFSCHLSNAKLVFNGNQYHKICFGRSLRNNYDKEYLASNDSYISATVTNHVLENDEFFVKKSNVHQDKYKHKNEGM